MNIVKDKLVFSLYVKNFYILTSNYESIKVYAINENGYFMYVFKYRSMYDLDIDLVIEYNDKT